MAARCCGENARGDTVHIALDGLGQRLLDERRARRDKPDGPAFDDARQRGGVTVNGAACAQ